MAGRVGVLDLVCLVLAAATRSACDDFGPLVTATQGEAWPKPQLQVEHEGFVGVLPSKFSFNVTKRTCGILQEALGRYSEEMHSHWTSCCSARGGDVSLEEGQLLLLSSLEVQLMSPCEERPYLGMDEHYELRINSPGSEKAALLTSQSIWGILRGLETFSQLLHADRNLNLLRANSTAIMDFPRFTHRGLLLDTSRHFLPTATIRTVLDGMEMNKMNVFHWHIVDSQSFPYQSEAFPNLSKKGAYNSAKLVYSQQDVRNITEYARLRGIRVVPEFDTPVEGGCTTSTGGAGHASSWGRGQPGLLTPCHLGAGDLPDGTYGPVNPVLESTYSFMAALLREAAGVFGDRFLHLGGDEVTFECWESNPDVTDFMSEHGIGNSTQLEQYYMSRLLNITSGLNVSAVVWQDVFDNGVSLPRDTIVHVWNGIPYEELAQVTAAGHQALLSSCWYLDSLEPGGSWSQFYDCEPTDFSGTEDQKALVMGGEACMWGEMVDESNVVSRVWPYSSLAAEKLWSSADADTEDGAARRLEEHYCRMKRRGVGAQPPNGPGYCL
ncbi:beta-hexosaminidase subunit alpha-like isoform X2 [Bacillus rossius redtenbacheri]|uniref:beta-hexosaminidase subunit alpha-like isoform X2 n=1 Tax=Bacillus rossius redtenbacheri TaxID=93214 RepID=UPI002FDE585C